MSTLKWTCLAVLCLAASACSPQIGEAVNLRIALSPAAQPAGAAVASCVPALENLTVSFEILHPNVVELEDVDFYIQLGEPQELPEFTAQLAVEQIVVVLHPGNALELDKAQIADLFSGRVPDWAVLNGEPAAVHLWVGAQSDEGRKAFERILLLSSPIAGWAYLATNPEDLRAAIAADPNAAGILPAAWVNGEVQAVEIGLELPVLALASQEPSGAAREMLVCLQSGRGRSQLGGLYLPLEP